MIFWKLKHKWLTFRAKRLYHTAEEVLEKLEIEQDPWWMKIQKKEYKYYMSKADRCRIKARRIEVRNGGWIRRRKRWQ